MTKVFFGIIETKETKIVSLLSKAKKGGIFWLEKVMPQYGNELLKQHLKCFLGFEELPYQERLQEVLNFFSLQITQIGQEKIIDIQKNAPEIWEEISLVRKRVINENYGLTKNDTLLYAKMGVKEAK